ncbi:aminopeptidase [Candidatus Dojkabacteria bacterium]|nr:aminopeptidase [Candidatus Dojkabacteria bacterium]
MYKPSKKTLEKYADLLVNFALNSGKGVKKDEIVMCIVDDVAKPLLIELHKTLLKAGAHPIMRMIPTGINKDFFVHASDGQIVFFPEEYQKARCDLIDHQIGVLSEVDPQELKDINPEKIMKSADARKKVREWLDEKERRGKFTWTMGLYGTEGMAKEANMSLEEYWQEIIHACYLDKENPKEEWKKIMNEQERIKKELNSLDIDYVHAKGENIDLKVKIGPRRQWLGGNGRNIPSYEIFTSPDWRGTEGYIYFNQPLYRYGNILRDIRIEFKEGLVSKAEAGEGQEILEKMIKRENANKVGEFSLTDSRFSRITKFMANTLYDENVGGENGNMHIAVGMAYKDAFEGDARKVKKDEWEKMGFNYSPEHTDIITTEERKVTAYLLDGGSKVIYEHGKFTV